MRPLAAATLAALAMLSWAFPGASPAQDVVAVLKESTLNRIAARPGQLSGSGATWSSALFGIPGFNRCRFAGYAGCADNAAGGAAGGLPVVGCAADNGNVLVFPAGERIPWAWRVTEPHFTVREGSLSFTATVRGRVAGQDIPPVTRTVGANVEFFPGSNRLYVTVSEFKVPLAHGGKVVREVDVARLYSLAFPLDPQAIPVTLQDGSEKTITARFVSVVPSYLDKRIRLEIDVGY